jgi:hypothetical protein
MDPNPTYLVQIEGWRGVVRQAPSSPEPAPSPLRARVPLKQVCVRVIEPVRQSAA